MREVITLAVAAALLALATACGGAGGARDVTDAEAGDAPDAPEGDAPGDADAAPGDDGAACRLPGYTRCGWECVDLRSDPRNCGACGAICPAYPHAVPTCEDAACSYLCRFRWADVGGEPGCEYFCTAARPPVESCNGRDDDCDTETDEDFDCVASAPAACEVDGCPGTRPCSADCTSEGPCTISWMAHGPRPIAPANGARAGSHLAEDSLRPTFRWEPVPAACGDIAYDLQVDDSCSTPGFASCTFPSPKVDATALAAASWRSDADLPIDAVRPYGRRYYWRVRACDAAGGCGAWSPVRCVDVGREPNDFDGDGYADLLVGADETVHLFLGGAPIDTTADETFPEPVDSDSCRFGDVVAGAGDVDADGFADFAIGRTGCRSGSGEARLLLGAAAVAEARWITLPAVERSDPDFGSSVAGAGDVDADGYADLLLGGGERAYLLLGGSPPDPGPDLVLEPTDGYSTFGATVAGAGDVDGDGHADMLVGAPGSSAGGAWVGHLYLFLGGADADAVPDMVAAGLDEEMLGAAIAGIGDVDGDGYADVAAASSGPAGLYVWRGSPSPRSLPVLAFPDPVARGAGSPAIAGAGDVNGDGFADLLLGRPDDDAGRADAGAAFLYLGGDPPGTTPYLRVEGATIAANMGMAVAGVGDVDGDGHPDAAIAAPNDDSVAYRAGCVTLLRGGSLSGLVDVMHFDGTARVTYLGRSVAAAPP
jgi:hypothetical protein